MMMMMMMMMMMESAYIIDRSGRYFGHPIVSLEAISLAPLDSVCPSATSPRPVAVIENLPRFGRTLRSALFFAPHEWLAIPDPPSAEIPILSIIRLGDGPYPFNAPSQNPCGY